METKIITNPQELFDELEDLKGKGGYVFRGQANSTWKLIPNAFRDKTLNQIAKDFPISEAEIERWGGNRLKKIIEIKLGREPSGSEEKLIIQRYLNLTVHIMRYNFRLFNFFEKNSNKLPLNDKEINKWRDASHWTSGKTFLHFIENDFQNLINLKRPDDGSLIKPANISEVLAGRDETLPQHYDVPTAALDVTKNPYIALFFALDLANVPEFDSRTGLFIAKKIPNAAKCFSIYVYKQNINDLLTSIKDPDESLCSNERAKNQEGQFIFSIKPCSFYLLYGRFPCIDDHDEYMASFPQENRSFELIKYNVQRNKGMLTEVEKVLIEKGITKEFLLC